MGEEIELKLIMSPDDADRLEASGLMQSVPEKAKQRSIYFDTPDHALSKMGFSLRIRHSGKKCVQTIKADGASAAGLFARGEWEQPVKGDIPILDHKTPILNLLGDKADSIGPVFEVHVERWTWIIGEEEATIELVLDRGEVVTGDLRSSICEIELELKDGNPAALFTLARRLNAVIPMRLGVLTKAERGYGLKEQGAKAFKARPVLLDSDWTAARAFQNIVQTCVRQFRQSEELLLLARDAVALHDARVALRRLMSAFSIFKPLTSGETGAALREDLRWLVSELGNARDLDVLLERSTDIPLHDVIKRARDTAYHRAESALQSPRVRSLMLDLAQWVAIGDWLRLSDTEDDRQLSAREFAIPALNRFRHKVRKDGRDLVHLDDEARHEVRKDAKKLRYAAEFFKSLFASKRARKRWKKFIAALEELQDKLGSLNDLATTPQVLVQLGLSDDPDASALLGKGKRQELIEAAADAYDELIDTKRFWR